MLLPSACAGAAGARANVRIVHRMKVSLWIAFISVLLPRFSSLRGLRDEQARRETVTVHDHRMIIG
jgi:hypothetical protein